jgi:LacI family transcriptional regulator
VDVRGSIRHRDIPLVRIDDDEVGRVAAHHLLERGFVHFGYYGPPRELWAEHRRDAFTRAVTEAGAVCRHHEKPWKVSGATGWDRAEAELAEWLRQLPKPAGVMAASDRFGQRVIAAARRAAIKVPEELAIVGVDNDEAICEVCDPPLSSVVIDSVQQGYKAAALLHRMMRREPAPAEPLLIKPSGVRERQSTDILAIDDPMIADAVRFIRDHACEGIGVSDVLREVPLSRSVLQRRFRRIFGQTANDMIVSMRLRRAKELLIGTDLSIARIAEIAGFRYQRYLGSVFRKKLGVTPFRYRQQAGPGRQLT